MIRSFYDMHRKGLRLAVCLALLPLLAAGCGRASFRKVDSTDSKSSDATPVTGAGNGSSSTSGGNGSEDAASGSQPKVDVKVTPKDKDGNPVPADVDAGQNQEQPKVQEEPPAGATNDPASEPTGSDGEPDTDSTVASGDPDPSPKEDPEYDLTLEDCKHRNPGKEVIHINSDFAETKSLDASSLLVIHVSGKYPTVDVIIQSSANAAVGVCFMVSGTNAKVAATVDANLGGIYYWGRGQSSQGSIQVAEGREVKSLAGKLSGDQSQLTMAGPGLYPCPESVTLAGNKSVLDCGK